MSTDVMLIGSVVHNTGRSLVSGWVFHGTNKFWGERDHCIYLTSFQDKWAIIATAWHQWNGQGHCRAWGAGHPCQKPSNAHTIT